MSLFDALILTLLINMRRMLALALFALEVHRVFGSRVNA